MLIDLYASEQIADIVLDTSRLKGHATILLPKELKIDELEKSMMEGEILAPGYLDAAVYRHLDVVERTLRESRASAASMRSAARKLKSLLGGAAVRFSHSPRRPLVGVQKLVLPRSTTGLLVLDPPEGAKLGDAWDLAVMLVAGAGRVVGGSTYRCRVVLPPDEDSKIQIHPHFARTANDRMSRLYVKLAVGGEPITRPDEAEVHVASFTALGMLGPPKKLIWSAEHEAFVLEIDSTKGSAAIRRMTIIARTKESEARKTINIG
jgi:hypothetical protein